MTYRSHEIENREKNTPARKLMLTRAGKDMLIIQL